MIRLNKKDKAMLDELERAFNDKSPETVAKRLFLNKLNESGLYIYDAGRNDVVFLAKEEMIVPFPNRLPAMLFNYYDVNKKLMVYSTNKPYFRLRYLYENKEELLQVLKKPRKYDQAHGSDARAYFPLTANFEVNNVKQPIMITEGELKAIKASKHVMPTIGLGGCSNFALKKSKKLIDDLEQFNFKNRSVFLCFDNDWQTNKEVKRSLKRLFNMLKERGAFVYNVILPQHETLKGLDDFLALDTNLFDYVALSTYTD